jgi:DNA-binding response OmpR family regulator
MGHVLVVEDERDIAELVRYHLEKAGFSARTVSGGTAGYVLAGRSLR